MMNPTLSDLVGAIQTVTLGDDEARRRGTQKSVLERKAPPTFDGVVEIQDWDRVAVRLDVAEAVDAILRGRGLPAQIRVRRPSGEIDTMSELAREPAEVPEEKRAESLPARSRPKRNTPLRVYPYGLNQNRVRQAARRLNLPIIIVSELLDADALFTLRTYYRQRPQIIVEAERRGVPVYVLRNNTVVQIENYMAEIFGLSREPDTDHVRDALREAKRGADRVLSGERSSVQLSPQEAYIRRMQHELARESELLSRSSGREPRRRVTISNNR